MDGSLAREMSCAVALPCPLTRVMTTISVNPLKPCAVELESSKKS